MLKLEKMKQQFSHLSNEMLDNLIEWWQRPPDKFERDLVLPRLLEERLNRVELDYDEAVNVGLDIRDEMLALITKNGGYVKVHNERKKRK